MIISLSVAHHQIPSSCEGEQETVAETAGDGQISPLSNPRWHSLFAFQLGSTQRSQTRQHPRYGYGNPR